MHKIQVKRFYFSDKKCISVHIGPAEWSDDRVKSAVKSIKGIKYEPKHRCWHVLNTPENIELIKSAFRDVALLDTSGISTPPEVKVYKNEDVEPAKEIVKMNSLTFSLITDYEKHLEIKRYSQNTIKNYITCLYQFFAFYKDMHPLECTYEEVQKFEYRSVTKKKVSFSYQNIMINALKGFYSFHKTPFLQIEEFTRPRRPKVLPNFLDPTEVQAIIKATTNVKHRAMLSITYGCGLRSGEVLKLKPEDIDSKRFQLRINGGKGNKDRFVPISPKLIEQLRAYYKMYEPKVYLFEGQEKGEQYSKRSFQSVLKASVYKAGINKPVTLHWLRHSFATEMMNKGVNLRFIQDILGHKSSKTTEIYTHVTAYAKVRLPNPFDDLDI